MAIETAIPAFIGYTERAGTADAPALNVPVRIASLSEYEQHFGGGILGAHPGGPPIFSVAPEGSLTPRAPLFSLYASLRLFYANGGGPCYIVSAGTYADAAGAWTPVSRDALLYGLASIEAVTGPTLLVIPDASLLPVVDHAAIAQAMLKQAGETRDRLALLDVPQVRALPSTPASTLGDAVTAFRASIGTEYLSYGAAYLPYLDTSIVEPADLDETSFAAEEVAAFLGTPQLALLYERAARLLNRLPASAAVAGVMHAVDTSRGVWCAPANVTLGAVVGTAFAIDDEAQADLNVPLDGKAINAIRNFVGRGATVWGARTLDGNSQDFRYLPVRRTVMYLEQSIELAIRPFGSAANDARTWASVVATVSRLLRDVWTEGGLQGATSEDAFSVQCGLGTTITPQDVLDGTMVVVVRVAVVHPAEYIELTFRQRAAPA